MTALSLSGTTFGPFVGFAHSCVWKNGMLTFGDGSAGSDGHATDQYVCIGVYVSTTTSATSSSLTSTTLTQTSSSATTTTPFPDYSLMPAGITCYEGGLSDVIDSAECFGIAKKAVGYGDVVTLLVPVSALTVSCVYDISSGQVFYSTATGATAQPNSLLQYICPGIFTSTETSATLTTSSISTASTTVSTTISATELDYSMLPASETCYDTGTDDVPTKDECFGDAATALGLNPAGGTYVPGSSLGLSCVYDPSTNNMLFSDSTGSGTIGDSGYNFVCRGIATSTVSSTSASTASSTMSATTITLSSSLTAVSATATATSTTSGNDYTLLSTGQTCHDAGMVDVTTASECFGSAATYVGLSSSPVQDFSAFAQPFSCIFKTDTAKI
ncbi:unnamed protein product, partial [Prorocentrum cordatum]